MYSLKTNCYAFLSFNISYLTLLECYNNKKSGWRLMKMESMVMVTDKMEQIKTFKNSAMGCYKGSVANLKS